MLVEVNYIRYHMTRHPSILRNPCIFWQLNPRCLPDSIAIKDSWIFGARPISQEMFGLFPETGKRVVENNFSK